MSINLRKVESVPKNFASPRSPTHLMLICRTSVDIYTFICLQQIFPSQILGICRTSSSFPLPFPFGTEFEAFKALLIYWQPPLIVHSKKYKKTRSLRVLLTRDILAMNYLKVFWGWFCRFYLGFSLLPRKFEDLIMKTSPPNINTGNILKCTFVNFYEYSWKSKDRFSFHISYWTLHPYCCCNVYFECF